MLSKSGILNTLPLNVQRKNDSSKNNNDITKSLIKSGIKEITAVLHNEKEENFSVSTRSSLTEMSDIVKLTAATNETKKNENLDDIAPKNNNVIESKQSIALYIGDLEKFVTEDMLKNFFAMYKSLLSVKICVDSHSGESLGYGYLNLTTKEEADDLMERFNYTPIFGKVVRIMPSLRNSQTRKNMGTNVFFSDLPLSEKSITTRDFYNFFKAYGNILSCKLNTSKNIGFIFFENESSAKEVISKFNANELLYGYKINCGVHIDKSIRKNLGTEKQKSASSESCSHRLTPICRPNEHSTERKSILVKNLPKEISDYEISSIFGNFGSIESTKRLESIGENIGIVITYSENTNTKEIINNINKLDVEGHVVKAFELTKLKSNESPKNLHNSIKKTSTIYLGNLSTVCTKEFLTQLCIQESIKIDSIEITSYNKDPLTFSGYVKCKTKFDAKKLFKFIRNRLIGGSVVSASWENTIGGIPISNLKQENTSSETNTNPVQINIPVYNPAWNIGFIPQYPNQYLNLNNQLNSLPNQGYSVPQAIVHQRALLPKSNINKKHVLELLRRQVKKGLDFLKFPSATRESNLTCITKYIFEMYWSKDVSKLNTFLSLLNSSTYNEGILQKQIEDSANYLGFGRY
ncbi:hypothetical protein Kpol_1018p122 [Vanderwaltozyma polyspora DSM 70294]|uniref:RRM domain-containing protein n=1 Tax=Vanderwaltozyma polyspora (strain ATCC 22028 / DSM 70294 / BCRC 21397 / CBS 2163 / NBRC 10782 / NRRL Y-8283 / UCD 57-17) TaxID=436907 RepID=A7TDW6_VANPO|nr:uncharacterized protein Kpol_1018p122 [Vanderwaltozyma polyspora DSM 70294]EDO19586.1 hypothetical protein Kpol_1018p122 [Vanderwaltozyma polyspora DSM 70294]